MSSLLGTRWWSWQRMACLLFTGAILFFIFRRIDGSALRDSLSHAKPQWVIAAFVAYGFALVFGGLRWHLSLHAIRRAVHVAASIRLTFIGHFFFLIFLGAATGDIAKSAVYSRWFRHRLPELAASTPIDRALGALAALLVGAVAVALGFLSGGFQNLPVADYHFSKVSGAIAFLAIAVIIVALVSWKPAGEAWWARSWRTFRDGVSALVAAPGRFAFAGLLALATQIALSAVFALNVRAAAGESVPWLKLAWTFPTVMMLSCLPITVAGAGVREVLAITFLGLYGVPASDCVGAAMLTLICKVTWALVGGLVLARETAVQQNRSDDFHDSSEKISIIIPALNEAESLPATISFLRKNESIHEIIIVDGGSTDRTREVAEELGCRVLTSKPGRGGQMRAGAAAATGDILLLLHADTWLPPHATRALLDCLRDRAVVAGGFWKEFRQSPLLLLGSKWKCAVRLWIGRRIAGDQGMFIRREALEKIGGVPDMALMEEFALCVRLRRIGRLALADAVALTSARRFQKRGVIRTYLRMWRVATQYRLGASPAELRKVYERE